MLLEKLFKANRTNRRQKLFRIVSGFWVLVIYVALRLSGSALKSIVTSEKPDLAGGEIVQDNSLREVVWHNKLEGSVLETVEPKAEKVIIKERVRPLPSKPNNDKPMESYMILQKPNKSPDIKHVENKAGKVSEDTKAINDSLPGKTAILARLSYGEAGKGIDFLQQTITNRAIVSHHDFSYIINPVNLCSQGDNLLFILYVHSSPKYFERRQLIRRTWGNPRYHENVFKVLFVFGYDPGDKTVQEKLQREAETFGDILQENFIDSYRNLTHKGIAALKWIDRYCNKPKFVLKADDDTFVDTFKYIRYIRSLETHGTSSNTILCAVWYGMTVLRTGKWGVKMEQYNDTSYPTYCSGCAFTFTMDVARAIHHISYYVPFLWVDDAYITGILPRRIGNITFRNFGSTYEMNSDKLIEKFTGASWWGYIFSSDIHKFQEIDTVWDFILEKFNVHRLES